MVWIWGLMFFGCLFILVEFWLFFVDGDCFELMLGGKSCIEFVVMLEKLMVKLGIFWLIVSILFFSGKILVLDGIVNSDVIQMKEVVVVVVVVVWCQDLVVGFIGQFGVYVE